MSGPHSGAMEHVDFELIGVYVGICSSLYEHKPDCTPVIKMSMLVMREGYSDICVLVTEIYVLFWLPVDTEAPLALL